MVCSSCPWPPAITCQLVTLHVAAIASDSRTDNVLHFVNWFILVGGLTVSMLTTDSSRQTPKRLLWIAGTGIGAVAAVGWEAAEYYVWQAGVGGLSLTYGDTISDLLLSTAGGAFGALTAIRLLSKGVSHPPLVGSSSSAADRRTP